MKPESRSSSFGEDDRDRQLRDIVASAVHGLKFGEIVINIHDGKIVQVTRVEKTRVDKFNPYSRHP